MVNGIELNLGTYENVFKVVQTVQSTVGKNTCIQYYITNKKLTKINNTFTYYSRGVNTSCNLDNEC